MRLSRDRGSRAFPNGLLGCETTLIDAFKPTITRRKNLAMRRVLV